MVPSHLFNLNILFILAYLKVHKSIVHSSLFVSPHMGMGLGFIIREGVKKLELTNFLPFSCPSGYGKCEKTSH